MEVVHLLENRWSSQKPYDIDDVDRAVRNLEEYSEQGVWAYSIKYILITLGSRIFRIRTSQAKIEQFYADAKLLCANLTKNDCEQLNKYLKGLDAMWPKLRKQLEDPGFYRFVYEFAMQSAFLLPYFSVLSPHAPALEAARGYSVDMGGTYRRIDPETDPQTFRFVVGERTFRSFDFRLCNHQTALLNLAADMEASGLGKPSVFFVGGGMMPMVRFYYLRPEMVKDVFDRVVVYDSDPNMPEYLKMVFDRPLSRYGIDYHFEDAANGFNDLAFQGQFDAVDCTGVMSYCQTDEDIAKMLCGMKKMLKPGGIMMFDRQVMTPDMIRCALTLAWKTDPPLKPELTVKRAITRIRKIAARVGLVVTDTFPDEYNRLPALVDFILRNPSTK